MLTEIVDSTKWSWPWPSDVTMTPDGKNNIKNEFPTPISVKLEVLHLHLLKKKKSWNFIMADGGHFGFGLYRNSW